jgi:hypothetical protein
MSSNGDIFGTIVGGAISLRIANDVLEYPRKKRKKKCILGNW